MELMAKLEKLFLLIALLSIGYCVYVYLDAKHYQAQQEEWLDREWQQRAQRPAPKSGRPPVEDRLAEGAPIAKLRVPRLKISVMVGEGIADQTLLRAAGHVPGTALPGGKGNIGIAAHRDSYFRDLRRLRRDDRITLETPSALYEYRVETIRVVDPDDVSVLKASESPTVTLITCFPFDYVGAAPKRWIASARLSDVRERSPKQPRLRGS